MASKSNYEDTYEKVESKMSFDSNFELRFPRNYGNKYVTSFLRKDNSYYFCNETEMMNSDNEGFYQHEQSEFSFFKQSNFTHIQHTTTLDSAKTILPL